MMDGSQTLISTSDLRKLLQDMLDKHSAHCIRYRAAGEMWKTNFMRVVELTKNGAVLNDETISEFVHLADLSGVMQFELDGRFQGFEPHFHYEVRPDTRAVKEKINRRPTA